MSVNDPKRPRNVARSLHFSAVQAGCGGVIDVAAAVSRSRQLVKEEIDGGDLAVPGDDEIGSGVSRRLARTARHPTDPPPIADHLRRGERLISEVRMSSLDHARDAVDLVATAVDAVGFVEYGVFVEDLVDRSASTTGSISSNTSWRLRSNKVDTVQDIFPSAV